jgi:hypothetical protein
MSKIREMLDCTKKKKRVLHQNINYNSKIPFIFGLNSSFETSPKSLTILKKITNNTKGARLPKSRPRSRSPTTMVQGVVSP